jgi:branched-subunit amino acid ABC-type transport system permease component
VIAQEQTAELKARQAADVARKAGSRVSIVTGLSMLIGAFIACIAACLGGQRRDAHM